MSLVSIFAMALPRRVFHAVAVFLYSYDGHTCLVGAFRLFTMPDALEDQAFKVAVVPTKLKDGGSLDDWEITGGARACFREPVEEGAVLEHVVVPASILIIAKNDLYAVERKKIKFLKSTGKADLTDKQKGIVEAMLDAAKETFFQRLGLQALSRQEKPLPEVVHFYFIGHGDFGGISLVRKKPGWDVHEFLSTIVTPLVNLLRGKRLRLHLRSCNTFNYEFVAVADPEIKEWQRKGVDITLDGFDKAFSPAGFPRTEFYTGGSQPQIVSVQIKELMREQFKNCLGTWVDAEKQWTGKLSRSLALRVNVDDEMRRDCRALTDQLEGQLQLWLDESKKTRNGVAKEITHPVFRTLPETTEANESIAGTEPEKVQAFKVAIVPSNLGDEWSFSDWKVSAGARAAFLEKVPEVGNDGTRGAVLPMSMLIKAMIQLEGATVEHLKDIRHHFVDILGLGLSKSTQPMPEAVHFYFVGTGIYDQIPQDSSKFFGDFVRLLPGKQLRLHSRGSAVMPNEFLVAAKSAIESLKNEGADITFDVYLDGVIPAGFPITKFYRVSEGMGAADDLNFTPEQVKYCFGRFVDADSEQSWTGELSRKLGNNLLSGYLLRRSCKQLTSKMKLQLEFWTVGSSLRERNVDASMRYEVF